MRALVLILILVFSLAFPARAQDIVTGLSEYQVELTPSFRGQKLFLFGAVRADQADLDRGFDVIVIVHGEARPHLVRKKEKFFGVWLNRESRTIEEVPEYFAQASTRPLSEITDIETLRNLDIGIEQQPFFRTSADPEFVEGLIREKQRAGLYNLEDGAMALSDRVLFRADFTFPTRVPSGTYIASAYLFQNGRLLGKTDQEIHVEQAGLARALYSLAHNNPALYGLLAVLIALGAGYLAGFITRRRPKLG